MSYVPQGLGQADCNPPGTPWYSVNYALPDCPTSAESLAPYQCNWLENWYDPTACASAASPTPPPGTLPGGSGPTIASVDPNTGAVTMLTPQQQHVLDLASLQQQAQAGYVDCTQWYNQLFNSACPCTYCSNLMTWGLVAGAALLLYLVKK